MVGPQNKKIANSGRGGAPAGKGGRLVRCTLLYQVTSFFRISALRKKSLETHARVLQIWLLVHAQWALVRSWDLLLALARKACLRQVQPRLFEQAQRVGSATTMTTIQHSPSDRPQEQGRMPPRQQVQKLQRKGH